MEREEGLTEERQPRRQISRRTFLKWGAAAVGSALVGTFFGNPPEAVKKTLTPLKKPSKEDFSDLLSEEELEAVHIRIYQTPNVKLYLRKGIFDFPLFRDAKEKKLPEVAIVLVDHGSLSWNASERLATQPRIVWQAINMHPKDYPEEYWQERITEEEESLNDWTGWKKEDEERLSKLLSGELEREMQEELEQAKKWSTSGYDKKYWQARANELQKELNKILTGSKKQELEDEIKEEQDRINEVTKELKILKDRPRAIAKEAEEIGPQGTIVRLNPESPEYQKAPEYAEKIKKLLQKYPQLENKVFIFLTVGGRQKPHPTQSYPQPEQFIEWPSWMMSQVREEGKEEHSYRFVAPFTAGTILWHEMHHYQGSGEKMASEYPTDTRVLESITSAWEKYQATGDSSGYPFIFTTKEGIIVTKQIQPQSGSPPQANI